MNWINAKPRFLTYFSTAVAVIFTLLAIAGCQLTPTPEPEPTPESGSFVLINDTEQNICHLYFAPFAQEEQEFDVLAFATDTGEIAAGDTFRLASADYARLRDDVEYEVRAESCAGDTAMLGGTLHFPTGLVWSIHEW